MIEISCPSGLTFEANPIGGNVFVNVGDADRASSERSLTTTLRTCHVRTLAPGPYSFIPVGEGKPDWDRVLFADLLYAMFKLRMESFRESRTTLSTINALTMKEDTRSIGQVYEFEWTCGVEDCRRLCEAAVDLGPLCENIQPISEELRSAIASSTYLETKLPSGAVVRWQWSILALDRPMREMMKKRLRREDTTLRRRETPVELVTKHIKKVSNPDGTEIGPDLFAIHKWAARQGNAEEIDIMAMHIEMRQPTVDNEVNLVCSECNTEQKRTLPFAGPFFFPRTSPQAKRAIRTKMEKEFRKESDSETSSSSSSPG